jgi:hypothetical protein
MTSVLSIMSYSEAFSVSSSTGALKEWATSDAVTSSPLWNSAASSISKMYRVPSRSTVGFARCEFRLQLEAFVVLVEPVEDELNHLKAVRVVRDDGIELLFARLLLREVELVPTTATTTTDAPCDRCRGDGGTRSEEPPSREAGLVSHHLAEWYQPTHFSIISLMRPNRLLL